jgi:hypothetical protein
MDNETFNTATANRKASVLALVTATKLEDLHCLMHLHTKGREFIFAACDGDHSPRLRSQMDMHFNTFKQSITALCLAEAARLDAEMNEL